MTEVYLLFLQSVTPLFTNFNGFLQKEELIVNLLHEEMQKFMNKLATRFVKSEVIQQLNEEKRSFSALNMSRENQRDDQNIHIGLLTNSLLKKLLEEDIDDRKADVFFDSARKFYETAYKYCVNWFPLDDVFYKNFTFIDFAKRQSIDFEQIVSVIECFPTLKAKLYNDPRQIDACLEKFMIFQGLTDENIPSHAWNDAKVDVKPDKVFHRMDIIWGYLRERFQLFSSVALCVLTIPHSNVAEERVFSMIKKNKSTFPSSLDLKSSLNSIVIIKMNTSEDLVPCYRTKLPIELLKKCKTACKDYNK